METAKEVLTLSNPRTLVSFAAFSSVKWPILSRPYLMRLLKEIAESDEANFMPGLGDIIAGQYLERELKGRIAFERQLVKDTNKTRRENGEEPIPLDEYQIRSDFVREAAEEFSNFLPKIEGKNYHIGVAEKVFDKHIGVEILERLCRIRSDVRLVGQRDEGEEYDAEPKLPLRTSGFEEARAIMPRRKPWFYRIITSFMQTLINRHAQRTFSPPPSMILVGCTGTQADLPFYKGVYSVSVPALNKIDEVVSTENMVGVVVVKVIAENGRVRLVRRAYNFRPIIAKEREFVVPEGATKLEKQVLTALKHSPASLNTIHFRINDALKKKSRNGRRPKLVSREEIEEAIKALLARDIIVYRRNSNWYAIDDKKRSEIQVTLKDLLKGTRLVKHIILSCVHTGALKSFYRTFRRYLYKRAWDADAIFEVGDPTQDLAHQGEYTGEVLPDLLTPDKQEWMAAAIRAKDLLLPIFKLRLKKWIGEAKPPLEALLRKCLIWYVFTPGNHPAWKHYRKGTLVLEDFETKLRQFLVEGIIEILVKEGRQVDFNVVKQVVDEKVIRVGENGIVTVDGVTVGVKHPSKARTESKSHRIQDVVEYFWRTFRDLASRVAKKSKLGFALVYLANFHEMAATHVSMFGKVVLGVMNGAYLKDTSFETSKDKVVDYGFTVVTACINEEGELVYNDVEFDNYMDPDDAKLVFADRIMTSDILALQRELNEVADIPWR